MGVIDLCESMLPRFVSAYRPVVPIIVFTSSAKIARQLILYRGIYPVYGMLLNKLMTKCFKGAMNYTKTMGFVCQGDNVVFVGKDKNKDLGSFVTMNISVVP